MVKSCWAAGCKNRFVSGGSVTFHVFPKEPVLREQWIKAVNRSSCTSAKPRQPNPHDYVCSEHFQHSDFILSRHACHKRLKKDAVPSLKTETNKQKDTTRTSQRSQTASAAPDPPWEPRAVPSASLADLVSVDHQLKKTDTGTTLRSSNRPLTE
ncbi:THAP domain-containing protein 1-like [Thalassophryne amazonica]|uniref:THAP domain-containing protein 1-like n=1 Tax=Thalassophryne amazonica TaxID=390379 RepID=UPI0014714381|nr:THAP domain-containing protein 1-like [Thalassophryne amazonica]